MKVRVFDHDAKTAVAQGKEHIFEGEVVDFGQYRVDYTSALTTVVLVQDSEGFITDPHISLVQVVPKPALTSKPKVNKK